MSVVRWCAAVAAVGFGGAAAGEDKPGKALPESVVAVLEKAGEVTVYSLAGEAEKGADAAWRGAKVLGKTAVKDDQRKAVVAAAAKAVAEGGQPARCFIPRHGLEATHDGKTVALVICFECARVQVYDGDKLTSLTVSPSAQKALDGVLAAAKVPLDKPGK
ncbi:MAG: hypothetical protein C0501_19945 [Isosphaera sp.]|nr:hypothetical protein [Isosphaera sp.]